MELCEMPFDPKSSAKDVDRFVCSYLRKDGVFVLRMVTMHTGVIFASELLSRLWQRYFKIESECQRQFSAMNSDELHHPPPRWQQATDNILNVLRWRKGHDSAGNDYRKQGTKSDPDAELKEVLFDRAQPRKYALDDVDSGGVKHAPSAPLLDNEQKNDPHLA